MKILSCRGWALSVLVAVVAAVIGCAGGSSIRGIRFQGSLREGSAAKSGVVVTLVETGESDQTSSDGGFDIWSSSFASEATLRFQGSDFDSTVTVRNIPDNSEFVVVSAEFDPASRVVKLVTAYSDPGNISIDLTTPLPTPTPPPTSTPGDDNDSPFDENGNTNEFGIPSGITGNINRGRSVWSQNCLVCHSREKRGATYNDIRLALRTQPEMRSLNISSQQTADITAYLNRGAK